MNHLLPISPGLRRFVRRLPSAAAALAAGALIVAGCSKSPADKPPSNEFFSMWLQHHGESNVVLDATGVGLSNNPTRLRYSLYGSERSKSGDCSAELEFHVRMPDRREIVEFVAGSGDTPEKAVEDAKMNFVLSTFHPVYRGFLNPADPHSYQEKMNIGGQPRELIMGDTLERGETTNNMPDMLPMRAKIREALASLPLSPQTHWIKIIYANRHSKTMMCAVTVDNEESPALQEAIAKLPWPSQEQFYMAKQFIVIKGK
jgi:hypothetical protein